MRRPHASRRILRPQHEADRLSGCFPHLRFTMSNSPRSQASPCRLCASAGDFPFVSPRSKRGVERRERRWVVQWCAPHVPRAGVTCTPGPFRDFGTRAVRRSTSGDLCPRARAFRGIAPRSSSPERLGRTHPPKGRFPEASRVPACEAFPRAPHPPPHRIASRCALNGTDADTEHKNYSTIKHE